MFVHRDIVKRVSQTAVCRAISWGPSHAVAARVQHTAGRMYISLETHRINLLFSRMLASPSPLVVCLCSTFEPTLSMAAAESLPIAGQASSAGLPPAIKHLVPATKTAPWNAATTPMLTDMYQVRSLAHNVQGTPRRTLLPRRSPWHTRTGSAGATRTTPCSTCFSVKIHFRASSPSSRVWRRWVLRWRCRSQGSPSRGSCVTHPLAEPGADSNVQVH